MDPASTLGLSTESVYGYSISHIKRILDTEPPELPLCRRGLTSIVVTLKGQCGREALSLSHLPSVVGHERDP